MAVYKRAYRPYQGPTTSERWRFLVLPRYGFQEIFESRLLTAFFALCFVPFVIEALGVYVLGSDSARAVLGISGVVESRELRPELFLRFLSIQGTLAFLLAAWVSPVLISPDLVNGALPLYLSRPFSRAEYVLGKATVLLVLLSLITWLPVLSVFGLQASLAGSEWLAANARLSWAILAGGWIWIAFLTLLGMALSAWIRWRLVASAALAGVFFMGAAFGELWRGVLHNSWGRLLNPAYLIEVVWRDLFQIALRQRGRTGPASALDLSAFAAWMGLLALCALCLWMLDRRLRAREVVAS